MPANTPYQEFLTSLRGALPTEQEPYPALIIVSGSCHFLIQKALHAIRQHWESRFAEQTTIIDEENLTQEYLMQVWGGTPMFAASSLHMVRRIKKQKELATILKPFAAKTVSSSLSSLLLAVEADNLLVAMQKEVTRLQGRIVVCQEPAKADLNTFLGHLAQKQGVSLGPSAIELLLEVGANDFYKIENEINKLALLFANRNSAETQQPLQKKDISPHLGILREEHAFALTRYILANKQKEAALLVEDLVERGESPLAILGLLAKHYRTALRVKEANRSSMPSSVKLPGFLLRPYQDYTRTHTLSSLASALSRCQEADVLFKTSGLSSPEAMLQSLL